jgi:hypothetical protein
MFETQWLALLRNLIAAPKVIAVEFAAQALCLAFHEHLRIGFSVEDENSGGDSAACYKQNPEDLCDGQFCGTSLVLVTNPSPTSQLGNETSTNWA